MTYKEYRPQVDDNARYIKQTRRPVNPPEDKQLGSHIWWKQLGDQIIIAEKASGWHTNAQICLYKEELDNLIKDYQEKAKQYGDQEKKN